MQITNRCINMRYNIGGMMRMHHIRIRNLTNKLSVIPSFTSLIRRSPSPSVSASASSSSPSSSSSYTEAEVPFQYAAVMFDMDGTVTKSNIDFQVMRRDTKIAYGDLFTTMEAWSDESQIKRAMEVILTLGNKSP